MRNLNGLPLDDDVIDRILQFLPSFSTLYSAILTSKSFYQVYKAHPRSIIRAVAYNVIGPALPQALRAIRYQEHESARDSQTKAGVDDSETESDSDDNEAPTKPSGAKYAGSETESDDDQQHTKTSQISRTEDDEETDEKTPITPDEARQLCEIAKIVDHFEDLFSLRCVPVLFLCGSKLPIYLPDTRTVDSRLVNLRQPSPIISTERPIALCFTAVFLMLKNTNNGTRQKRTRFPQTS